jgi:hypothetical protein
MSEPPRTRIPRCSRDKYEWDEELQAIEARPFPFSSRVYLSD